MLIFKIPEIICSEDHLKEDFLWIKQIAATDFKLAFIIQNKLTWGFFELLPGTSPKPWSAHMFGEENTWINFDVSVHFCVRMRKNVKKKIFAFFIDRSNLVKMHYEKNGGKSSLQCFLL